MRLIAQFRVSGIDVVPWSVPDIGSTVTKTGKHVRFSKRPKKDQLHLGRASLATWQEAVRDAAKEAMASKPIPTGPVYIMITFFARTPPGKRHGQLWEVPLRLNDEGEYTKTQPRGKAEPDLVNLIKGTEDALQGAILENDVQTRAIYSCTLYGPIPGCLVTLEEIEPTDFPGHGDPIA